MNTWNDTLNSTLISSDLKEVIIEFLIPDNILMGAFLANFSCLPLTSLKIPKQISVVGACTKSIKRFASMPTPPIYPDWFVAAYPDVLRWLLETPENSKVYRALDESSAINIKISFLEKKKFLKAIIKEYAIKNEVVLECTQKGINENEKSKNVVPGTKHDKNGNIEFETFIAKSGFEESNKYTYDEKNQLVQVDKWGEDSYGEFTMTPFETYKYDNAGVLLQFIQYQHGGRISYELKYSTEFDNQNRLISRAGGWKTSGTWFRPSNEKKKLSFTIKFKYENETVSIYNYYNHREHGSEEFRLIERVKSIDLIRILNSYTGLKVFLL